MKLHTPEGRELMEVLRVERDGDRLVVRGIIMGTMPTRAVIRPEQIRAAFGLLSWGLIWSVLVLLFKRTSS
ncbi:MAG: hypothetical protein ACT4PZ_22325 [Panacagrimonas sp.]